VTGRRVIVEADGGSRGNPGPAGYGAVVRDPETGEVLAERKGSIGIGTNNVAEYRGLIAGLEAAAELGARDLVVRMDSKLVVEQMSGRWQVKHPSMRPLAVRAATLARSFDSVSFGWIPRAQNSLADRLANQAMDAAAEVLPVEPPGQPAAQQLSFEEPEFEQPVPTRSATTGTPDDAGWVPNSAPATRLVLLRHGVTEYSVAHRFAGRSDLDLTSTGLAQSRQAADRVAELAEVSAIYCSPLLRTRHTAQLLADRLGLSITIEDGLIETDFGDWDGHTFAEVRQKWPAELGRWLADPAVAPPGGESLQVTTERVRQAAERIRARHAGQSVALVSHVWPIKALVRLALGAPPTALHRMYLGAAAISVIDHAADGAPTLRSFNETGHLTG
jgi:broad specificity phosphatase PhoE/ribonuclease HI